MCTAMPSTIRALSGCSAPMSGCLNDGMIAWIVMNTKSAKPRPMSRALRMSAPKKLTRNTRIEIACMASPTFLCASYVPAPKTPRPAR